MATSTFSLRLVLPDVPDTADACITRLRTLIAGHDGISLSHVTSDGEALCVHFDPARIPLAEVETLVTAAGARLADEYGHVSIPFAGAPGEDAGRGLEDLLRQTPGVLEVVASVPAQRVRIEFDRRVTDAARLTHAGGPGRVPNGGSSGARGGSGGAAAVGMVSSQSRVGVERVCGGVPGSRVGRPACRGAGPRPRRFRCTSWPTHSARGTSCGTP